MKNSERNEKKTIDPEMQKIGERIKKLLKAKNITQEKVALKIGYTASTLSEKLAGKTKFDIDTIIKLSEILDCSTDYLLGVNDCYSKEPLVPYIAEYTGLSSDAVERLHLFKDPKNLKRYYKAVRNPSAKFDYYTDAGIREEFGNNKWLIALMGQKSVVWLSDFITYSPACLLLNTRFRLYLIECLRKIDYDSIHKEAIRQLREDGAPSDQIRVAYDQILIEQENCSAHRSQIKEDLRKVFDDFCNGYCMKLEKIAEEIHDMNLNDSAYSDE